MMKKELGSDSTYHATRCAVLMSAVVAAMALAVARAEDNNSVPAAPDASIVQPAPSAEPPRVKHHHVAKRQTAAEGIDVGVRRLTRALSLDPGQQESVRKILAEQHRRVLELRSGQPGAPVDATGALLAIYDQTKTRIRSILSDEQKTKYSVDVPRDDLAPAQADLQHWMDLQESKRRESAAEEMSK